jgi:hypothetical protein
MAEEIWKNRLLYDILSVFSFICLIMPGFFSPIYQKIIIYIYIYASWYIYDHFWKIKKFEWIQLCQIWYPCNCVAENSIHLLGCYVVPSDEWFPNSLRQLCLNPEDSNSQIKSCVENVSAYKKYGVKSNRK